VASRACSWSWATCVRFTISPTKLRAERQVHLAAIHVCSFLLVHQEQVIAARPPRDVGILPQFDVPFGSQYEQAPIAPGTQAGGGEPIHADVAETAIAVQHHVAEILKLRPVLIIHVGHLRRCHIRHGRTGVIHELVRLMRPDVAQDAAVARRIPEPIGARFFHSPGAGPG